MLRKQYGKSKWYVMVVTVILLLLYAVVPAMAATEDENPIVSHEVQNVTATHYELSIGWSTPAQSDERLVLYALKEDSTLEMLDVLVLDEGATKTVVSVAKKEGVPQHFIYAAVTSMNDAALEEYNGVKVDDASQQSVKVYPKSPAENASSTVVSNGQVAGSPLTLHKMTLVPFDTLNPATIVSSSVRFTNELGGSEVSIGSKVILQFTATTKVEGVASLTMPGLEYLANETEYTYSPSSDTTAVKMLFYLSNKDTTGSSVFAVGDTIPFHIQVSNASGSIEASSASCPPVTPLKYKQALDGTWAGITTNNASFRPGDAIHYVVKGNNVTFAFTTSNINAVAEKVTINGTYVSPAAFVKTVVPEQADPIQAAYAVFTLKYTLPALKEGIVSFSFIFKEGAASTATRTTFSSNQTDLFKEVYFLGPHSASNVKAVSSEEYYDSTGSLTDKIVMPGDQITLSFEVPKKPIIGGFAAAPTVTQVKANSTVLDGVDYFTTVVNGSNTNSYTVVYTIKGTEAANNGNIIFEVKLKTETGGEFLVSFGGKNAICLLLPSSYTPKVEITSTNGISLLPAEQANCYAKPGDRLKITVYSNQPASWRNKMSIEVAGQKVDLLFVGYSTKGNQLCYKYTAIITFPTNPGVLPQTAIPYTVSRKSGGTIHAPGDYTEDSTQLFYLAPIAATSVTVSSDTADTEGAFRYAKEGSVITAKIEMNNGVELQNVKILGVSAVAAYGSDGVTHPAPPTNGAPYYYYEIAEGIANCHVWYVIYTIPAGNMLADETLIDIQFSVRDWAKQKIENETVRNLIGDGNNPVAPPEKALVTYYAPISLDPVVSTSQNLVGEGGNVLIVKNDEEIEVTFTTLHPIVVGMAKLGTHDLKAVFHFVEKKGLEYHYKATFVVPNAPAADLEEWEIHIEVQDRLGQTYLHTPAENPATGCINVKYYAPLVVSGVTINSNNAKDGTSYVKEKDIITVTFAVNHSITNLDAVLAGKQINATYSAGSTTKNVEYSFSYTIQVGDVPDLSIIAFLCNIKDEAGNEGVPFTESSAGNSLKYYAPITAVTSILSNNAAAGFAKNGDTISLKILPNHEVTILNSLIGARGGAFGGGYVATPIVEYTIPLDEASMQEGVVAFALQLEDLAGNLLEITQTNDLQQSKVIYDRTVPTIVVAPAYNGFTNEDINFTLVYEDEYLDASQTSLTVNKEEQVAKSGGTLTEFTQTIGFTKDGEYRVHASAQDMAGNTITFSASMHVIVDKTNPSIRLQCQQNTFPSGFTLDKIFDIDETYVRDVVCSIADSEQVQDWTLEAPILPEGRKTVYLVVRDMAGNASVPITTDIYIDGTVPRPVVQEQNSGTVLQPDQIGEIVGTDAGISIHLETLHLGSESPDEFIVLQLQGPNGELLIDFLAEQVDPAGVFHYALPKHGAYTLIVMAKDGVDNETETLRYQFVYREKTIGEFFASGIFANTIVRVVVAILATGLIGLLLLMLWKNAKKKQNS